MTERYIGRLLIVDDDVSTCAFWKLALAEEGFRVDVCHNLNEMRDIVRQYSIDAVLLDLDLGTENGLAGLPFLLAESPFSKIFILTANASIESAVAALQQGATGYVLKSTPPADIATQIKGHLSHPLPTIVSDQDKLDFAAIGLIGKSKAHQELCQKILQLKDVNSNILILGESGVGKEIVARCLHRLSHRAVKRFEAINCGAIPESLLESELFGHKKGAFTDARVDRKGIFELCSGGSLLLDEIGDMPVILQTKLLRVLQERTVTAIGSSDPITIDTRVIAATHRDLVEEIQNGKFREDLYYRLSVVILEIPPLRHRKVDIPLLIEVFQKDFNQRFRKETKFPSPEMMKRVVAYDWPGNIRELRNAVERSVVLATSDELDIRDMFQHVQFHRSLEHAPSEKPTKAVSEPDRLQDEEIFDLTLTEAKQVFEKLYIERLLNQTNGNITEISKRSGRYRADIYKLLEKYDINYQSYRSMMHLSSSKQD